MRLTDFDAVLFDLDGTLYHEGHALPGAAEVLGRLKSLRVAAACITNASAKTPQQLSQTLAAMGVHVPAESIYSSGQAAADWILERWDRPRVCNFGGSAFEQMLAPRAVFVTGVDEKCDVAFVGTHTRVEEIPFNMDRALTVLAHLRQGAHLVLGCADRVFPIVGGAVEFGSGSLGAMFRYAADLPDERVHYAGKPEASFFEHLCKRLCVRPDRCLLVGDNLESDIAGGRRVKMTTALLLTGITDRALAERSTIKPDMMFDDLPALIAAMG